MSIVIPAGHLARTVITVRCNSPHAAPHIECALDEQTQSPFSNAPREPLSSPRGFSCDGRTTAPGTMTPPSPSGSINTPQTDLNVVRGMDHRGHYVRLSFLSGHPASHRYNQQSLEQDNFDGSYFSLSNALPGPTSSLGLSQDAYSFRRAAPSVPLSIGGSPLASSSTPIMSVSIVLMARLSNTKFIRCFRRAHHRDHLTQVRHLWTT